MKGVIIIFPKSGVQLNSALGAIEMSMQDQKIEAHKITKPIQLMAVWFVALLLLDSAFLLAAVKVTQPAWLAPTLVISAIVFVPLFLVGVFLMQTVFRKELQEDQYYSEWLIRQEEIFSGFEAENVEIAEYTALQNTEYVDIESLRIRRYEEQQGLFLVHTWRPSMTPGQIADIVIWLHQHGEGPLSKGEIEKVEYQLGPKFFKSPQIKTNASEQYRIEVSAYGPMLCIAKVFLRRQEEPILLYRYINFEEAPNKALQRTAYRRR